MNLVTVTLIRLKRPLHPYTPSSKCLSSIATAMVGVKKPSIPRTASPGITDPNAVDRSKKAILILRSTNTILILFLPLSAPTRLSNAEFYD